MCKSYQEFRIFYVILVKAFVKLNDVLKYCYNGSLKRIAAISVIRYPAQIRNKNQITIYYNLY